MNNTSRMSGSIDFINGKIYVNFRKLPDTFTELISLPIRIPTVINVVISIYRLFM